MHRLPTEIKQTQIKFDEVRFCTDNPKEMLNRYTAESVYRGDMKCMIREIAIRCDIEDVINSFEEKKIEEWLDNHAYEYGYTKVED